MSEPNTDELIATSRALLDDTVASQPDSTTAASIAPADDHDDSVMDSESHNDDSLNDTADSVGDTFQAVSYVSKTQKRLYPSDVTPPCTMDPDKVCRERSLRLSLVKSQERETESFLE